jgi:outer membrane lipoprotein SlyB
MRKLTLLVAVLSIAASLSGCAYQGGGYQQPTRLDVGRIIDVQQVRTNGSWVPGAAIGGVAGALTGRGHSTESKVVRAGIGALAGAAINKALTTGNSETHLVIQNRMGQVIQVAHNQSDLVPGDCVQIQTRYNGDVQIYRASSTQCNF